MYIIHSNKIRAVLITAGFISIFAIGWADYETGLEMSFSIFYMFPVIIITWVANMWTGVLASLISAFIWGTADRLGGHYHSYEWIPYWNSLVRLGFYLIVTFMLSRLKTGYEDRIRLIKDLEDTLHKLNVSRNELEGKAKELVRSNAELELFASAAAHDLREPLIVIGGYVRRLHKKYKDVLDADAGQLVDTITDGVSRMEMLINGLLSYARIESKGKGFVWVSGEKILDCAINNLGHSIEESKAVITRQPIADLMVDEVQLSQVFQNLIGNAIKFRGDKPPEIHVSAELKNDEWIFAVSDSGIGISPKNFEKIFGIFKRVHSKTEYPGCGIGLALCKKIVERHGGRIWVESDTGEGSVFYFTIPAVKQPEVTA